MISDGSSEDRIATTGTTSELYLDPDPVRADEDGAPLWFVYVGQDSGNMPLGLYQNISTEIFREWDLA